MKLSAYLTIIVVFILQSCGDTSPRFKYKYNLSPVYTEGYAEFYGAYYSNAGFDNNVVSLSLFSDSLTVENGALAGNGQYLFLEDIFVAKTDTLLRPGRYNAAKTGQAFSFFPGEVLLIDKSEFAVGSFIFYKEKRKSFSVQRYVSYGYFDISYAGNKHVFSCNFTLSDSSKITGSFNATLPYFDQSSEVTAGAARKKTKLIY